MCSIRRACAPAASLNAQWIDWPHVTNCPKTAGCFPVCVAKRPGEPADTPVNTVPAAGSSGVAGAAATAACASGCTAAMTAGIDAALPLDVASANARTAAAAAARDARGGGMLLSQSEHG